MSRQRGVESFPCAPGEWCESPRTSMIDVYAKRRTMTTTHLQASDIVAPQCVPPAPPRARRYSARA